MFKKKNQPRNNKTHFLKQLLLGLGLRRWMEENGDGGKESNFSLTLVKGAVSCSALPVSDWNHLDQKYIH